MNSSHRSRTARLLADPQPNREPSVSWIVFGLTLLGFLAGASANAIPSEVRDEVTSCRFRVGSVEFAGEGRIVLLEAADESRMMFADRGAVVSPARWSVAGSTGSPVAYVGGSTPRLIVTVAVKGCLPVGTRLELLGTRDRDGVSPLTTTSMVESSGMPDETLTFEVSTRSPLAVEIAHSRLDIHWTIRVDEGQPFALGSSSNRLMTTWGPPFGAGLGTDGGVSVRRLEYLTRLAAGRRLPIDIVAAVGTALTAPRLYELRRGLSDPSIRNEPFAVLDGIQADCRTLSTLMEQSLGLLGVPGARVMYVFPRTGTWRGLSSDVPEGSQQAEIRVDLLGNTDIGALYFEDENGPNRFQACCVWSGNDPYRGQPVEQWWMGGRGRYEATDFDVLMEVSQPNRRGTSRQYYVADLTYEREALHHGPIPYPDLPEVWGRSVDAATSAIRDAGYDSVIIVTRRTWFPWLAGRARRCYAPDTLPGWPASPRASIILEVYV